MIFFTDENISEHATKILDLFDRNNEVRAHADYFDKGTADTVWLQEIAGWKEKPVVICGDRAILTNKAERKVLKECGLMFVYLASGWTK